MTKDLETLLNLANAFPNFKDKLKPITTKIASEQAKKILEDIAKYVDKGNTYIHFGNVPKVGIYPASPYSTPVGIYSYPLTARIYDLLVKDQIPFMGDAKYLYVLQMENLLELDHQVDYKKYLLSIMDKIISFVKAKWNIYEKKLKDKAASRFFTANWNEDYYIDFDQVALIESKRLDTPEYFINDIVFKILNVFLSEADKINGTRFWYFLNAISLYDSKISSSLIRYLGYDGMLDLGNGIIHKNEPSQAVAVKTENIKILDFFENPLPKLKDSNYKELSKDFNIKSKTHAISDLSPFKILFEIDLKSTDISNLSSLNTSNAVKNIKSNIIYVLADLSDTKINYFVNLFEQAKENFTFLSDKNVYLGPALTEIKTSVDESLDLLKRTKSVSKDLLFEIYDKFSDTLSNYELERTLKSFYKNDSSTQKLKTDPDNAKWIEEKYVKTMTSQYMVKKYLKIMEELNTTFDLLIGNLNNPLEFRKHRDNLLKQKEFLQSSGNWYLTTDLDKLRGTDSFEIVQNLLKKITAKTITIIESLQENALKTNNKEAYDYIVANHRLFVKIHSDLTSSFSDTHYNYFNNYMVNYKPKAELMVNKSDSVDSKSKSEASFVLTLLIKVANSLDKQNLLSVSNDIDKLIDSLT